ncbi:hypothetical protein [Sinorhizobium meliloti]|uniref:hypothetical protein n=1 Tax=Rhizobium meliloti TaxID=382 RepID=UPI00299E5EB6|nr:hypothetical protein [Sinorhizobium meliloti]MDW9695627.1 hypothetical protein [Sinorhizobium meliloti]MDW9720506.1 hypothetical protein [Sinorhizobium meliloti]MDW9757712.1 hypothetical protein [Sinorhizobium meliloti]
MNCIHKGWQLAIAGLLLNFCAAELALALDTTSKIREWSNSSGAEQMQLARMAAEEISGHAQDADVVELMFCIEKAYPSFSPDDTLFGLAKSCWILMNRQ